MTRQSPVHALDPASAVAQEQAFPGLAGSLHYVDAPADASAKLLALINKLVLKVQALIGFNDHFVLPSS